MSERTHAELLISESCAKLSAIPKDDLQPSVSLASIGSYEVRILLRQPFDVNDVPQFWLRVIRSWHTDIHRQLLMRSGQRRRAYI